MRKEDCCVRIVDDDEDMRESLACLLEFNGWTTRSYADAKAFLMLDSHFTPGCVVLDFRMPGMTGLELLGELSEQRIRIPVIFLTAYGDVPLAVRAMQRGAVDFLMKPVDPDTFLAAVGRAVGMEPFIRMEVGSKETFRRRVAEMSVRERDVLGLLARTENISNKLIAERLGLSERTVENYRSLIYRRLGIHSERELRRLLGSAEFPDETTGAQSGPF